MRKAILLAVTLCACAAKEEAAPDSAAAAPSGPAPLTAEMVAGGWNGMTMGETSDSVTNRWTTFSLSDTEQGLVIEGSKDTVRFTRTFDADSMIATSAPYPATTEKGAPMVTFQSIGRLVDGKLVGTGRIALADKPDSVLQRVRFQATKAP